MFGEQSGHPLRPTLERFGAGKGNDNRENFLCLRSNHSAFGIACGAAMRTRCIGENGQSFQIQIVFANSLVGFARAPGAKHDVTGDVSKIIKANRQATFNRNEIDTVHTAVI